MAPSARLGAGVFVKMQSIVSPMRCSRTTYSSRPTASWGHDVHVGAHSQISAFTHIAGNAYIGERCYLGVRASVREECTMGDDVVVAMGRGRHGEARAEPRARGR